MWFTKNFRSIWWFIIVVCLSWILAYRVDELASGAAKPIDVLLFLVWVGVCLGPLFSEISLPGVTFKQQLEDTKREITKDIESLRSEIRNSVDVRSNVSPNFWVGMGATPPPDHKLGDVERRLHSAIDRLERQGYSVGGGTPATPARPLSERELVMFTSRRDIEIQLRAIAGSLDDDPDQRKHAPISRLLWLLTKNEVIDKQMANVIREVYAICSLAIHGEDVTESQVDFVQRNGPELVKALTAIRERDV